MMKYLTFKNLQDLLPFLPPVHHDFYNSLPHQTPGGYRRQEAAQECVPEEKNEDNFETDELLHVF
jgi:hypothetical protein